MKKFQRIFNYLGHYKTKLFSYTLFTILGTLFGIISIGMLSPFLTLIIGDDKSSVKNLLESKSSMKFIIVYLNNEVENHGQFAAIAVVCIIIILSTVLKNVFIYLSNIISAPIRSSIIKNLRDEMYTKVLQLPIGFFTDQKKGDIMSRMTNDIGEVDSSIVGTLEGLIKDPLTIIGYLCWMIIMSPILSIGLFILLPVTGIVIGRVSRLLKKQSKSMSEQQSISLSILDETLTGIRVIKAFIAENLMYKKYDSVNNAMFLLRNKMARRRDLASPLTEVLGVIVLSAILFFGGMLVVKYHVMQGGFTFLYRYVCIHHQSCKNIIHFIF